MATIKNHGGAAIFHATQIRRAIRDAEADGFVVDFNWMNWGQVSDMHLAVCSDQANWREATRIWPIVSGSTDAAPADTSSSGR